MEYLYYLANIGEHTWQNYSKQQQLKLNSNIGS